MAYPRSYALGKVLLVPPHSYVALSHYIVLPNGGSVLNKCWCWRQILSRLQAVFSYYCDFIGSHIIGYL